MKKFILGFITALLFTITLTSHAEIKEFLLKTVNYPIIVDGEKYSNNDFPVLNYEGTTYVPLKNLGDLLGVTIEWNDKLDQVEITSSTSQPDTSTNETTDDGLNIVSYNESKFVSVKDIEDKYRFVRQDCIAFKFNLEEQTCNLVNYPSKEPIHNIDIPVTVISGKSHISVDDYIKYVLDYLP